MAAVLPLKKSTWDGWIVCPSVKIGSSWWAEIYSGEMPLSHKESKTVRLGTTECLVPCCAPQWVKRGATLERVLAEAGSELVKAGIAPSRVRKALLKFRRQQPLLSILLKDSIGIITV